MPGDIRILIADDDAEYVALMVRYLSGHGYICEGAPDDSGASILDFVKGVLPLGPVPGIPGARTTRRPPPASLRRREHVIPPPSRTLRVDRSSTGECISRHLHCEQTRYALRRQIFLAAGSDRIAGTPIYRHRSSSRPAGCTADRGQKCAKAGKQPHRPYVSGPPLSLAVVEWPRDAAKGRARSPGTRPPTTATAKRRRQYPRMSNCAA